MKTKDILKVKELIASEVIPLCSRIATLEQFKKQLQCEHEFHYKEPRDYCNGYKKCLLCGYTVYMGTDEYKVDVIAYHKAKLKKAQEKESN